MMSNSAEDYFGGLIGPGPAEERIARDLRSAIEESLYRLGLFGRVFSRTKSGRSVALKLAKNGTRYRAEGKKMQDLFGVRIALYFADDSEIAQEVVRSTFKFDSASVDTPGQSIFGPTRCNLIFRLPDELAQQSGLLRREELIDATFEVQFRTVVSEGWHEVEHDMRYKRPADWKVHTDLDRALNGIIAALENCDWSMLKIFDELAWRHYKSGNHPAWIQAKFRLRLQEEITLPDELARTLTGDAELVKALFRVDRPTLLRAIIKLNADFPLTAQNLLFICNRFFVGHHAIRALEPLPIKQIFDRHEALTAGA